eukprot:9314330-Heterocapsa_arctica.AAC.1
MEDRPNVALLLTIRRNAPRGRQVGTENARMAIQGFLSSAEVPSRHCRSRLGWWELGGAREDLAE